jgi:hypothetical protein
VSISYYPYKYLYKLEELYMSSHSLDAIAARNIAAAETLNSADSSFFSPPVTAKGSGKTTAAGPVVDLNVMVHPPDLGLTGKNANYMQFSTFTMRGGVGSSTSDMNFEGPHQFVCLPIPSGIGATYEQGWDQADVGLLASGVQMGVEAAMGSGGRTLASSMDEVGETMKSAMGGKKAILGTVGKMIMGEAATQRASGRATFSNTYVTYTGPAFRDFSYNFSLKPLDRKESDAVRTIIRFFKSNSAPRQLMGSVMRLYELPKLFGISYHGRKGPMKHMNNIAKCALTNINVVYGGDRFAVFAEDSAPVQVDLTLQFKEVQLLAQSDMLADGAGF